MTKIIIIFSIFLIGLVLFVLRSERISENVEPPQAKITKNKSPLETPIVSPASEPKPAPLKALPPSGFMTMEEAKAKSFKPSDTMGSPRLFGAPLEAIESLMGDVAPIPNNSKWRILNSLYSMSIQQWKMGGSKNKIEIARQNGYVFYNDLKNNDTIDNLKLFSAYDKINYPVVYNPENKTLGVISGKLLVKLNKNFNKNNFNTKFGIKLVSTHPDIDLVVYQVNTNQNLISLVDKIKKFLGVVRVDVEIIGNRNVSE